MRRATATCLLWVACALVACSPKFDWREFRSDADGFAILMPDRSQSSTRELVFNGQSIRMTLVSCGVGQTLFAAGAAELPAAALAPDQVATSIAWFRDALVRNFDGRVSRVISVGLEPAQAAGRRVGGGESVQAQGRAGSKGRPARLAARFHVADDRLYQVVAIGAEGELSADVLATFFDSFRLLPMASPR